jgi:hypothetical protein
MKWSFALRFESVFVSKFEIVSAVPYHYIILRTGELAKDIVVPTAIAAAAMAGVAAAPVAAIEASRTHSFEKKFWEFISATISDIGKKEAKMSCPATIST